MDSMSNYRLQADGLQEQKTALDLTPVHQEQDAETVVGTDWRNFTICDKSLLLL